MFSNQHITGVTPNPNTQLESVDLMTKGGISLTDHPSIDDGTTLSRVVKKLLSS